MEVIFGECAVENDAKKSDFQTITSTQLLNKEANYQITTLACMLLEIEFLLL